MTDPRPEGPAAGLPEDAPPAPRMQLPAPPDLRTVPLTLRAAPPRAGLQWLREGFQAFIRRPLGLAGLFALLMFFALILVLVPVAGPVLLLGFLPLASLVFMLATQAVTAGRMPMPALAVAPLRSDAPRRAALLQLGFGYALASFVAMALSDAVDGGALEALQDAMARGATGAQEVSELLADPRLVYGGALRLVLAVAVAIPFWHAPGLVHWGGQTALQSLFSSTLAVWRNRGAFIVYALAWLALLAGFGLVVNLVALVLGLPQLLSVLITPALMLFATVFYATLWFSFLDCFDRRA